MTMIGLAISPCIARATGTSTPTITATISPETGDIEVRISPRLTAVMDGDNIEVRING